MTNIKVFSGSANPLLTAQICYELGIEQGLMNLKRFADDELFPVIGENVRGADCFIVQPTCAPANDNLMELLLMIDAFKRASADRITAVIPYYGYARQDRKDRPRVPISAKVVADMIEAAGAHRVLTMDLHSAPIGGFFNIPVDHLYALPVFLDYVKREIQKPVGVDHNDNMIVVSPDAGGVARARLMSMKLGVPLAIVDKNREAANVSEVMNVIGDVEGKDCMMIDDMIDTAGTLCKGAKALIDRGARSVRAFATHGVLSYDKKAAISAQERIEASALLEVILADTIPDKTTEGEFSMSMGLPGKIKHLPVAPLFAKAINAIHGGSSISSLFI